LIGVQEIDKFSIEYKGIQRKFIMLPELHSTLEFDCEANDCKHVLEEIKSQIKKIFALSEATNAVNYVSKYISEDRKNKKRFHDAVEDIVNVDDGISHCVLISTYLMQLARHATTCVDIYVETKASFRDPIVRKSDSFLKLVGSMFSLCDKSSQNRDLCAQTFPNARFHGVDYRQGEMPAYYEHVPIHLKGSDSELLLHSLTDAIDRTEVPYAEYGKELHDMIGKQFPKSNFTREEFINTFMLTWEQLPKITTSGTSRSFRLSARLFDAYNILRIMNTSWSHHGVTRGPVGCRGKVPRNIILFAGLGHTLFLRGFLSRLQGITFTNGFSAVRRSDNTVFNPLTTSHHRNYTCLNIPYKQLPFINSMLLNDEYIFKYASNRQLLDYMEAYNVSDLDASWWEDRNPKIKNRYGFDPMWIFLITQPYLNLPHVTYPTHPRQLKFNALGEVDDSILRNMLIMQVVGTSLVSIVPTHWRVLIDKHITATNVVEAQVLQIATSRTVPDVLHKLYKAEHISGKTWISRFTSNEPISLRKYSTKNRTHDVFKGVKFLFGAGPTGNISWALWCGRLFVYIVRGIF